MKDEQKISAVIFDLDGTVLDNEGEWEEAFVAVVAGNGIKIDTQWRQPNGWIHEPGIGTGPNWKRLVGGEEGERLAQETWMTYQKNLGEPKIRDGVVELVEKIKEREWGVGLATSTAWHVVEEELEQLVLYLAFEVTTTGEEVLVPKPDPEIYLLTAQKLEAEPGKCLVIEDSIAGVRSAKEAGCKVVGLVSDYAPVGRLKSVGASWVVEDMKVIFDYIVEKFV